MHYRLQVASTHGSKRANSSPDTGEIDHLGHLHKTAPQLSHKMSPCTMKRHLASSKRACTKFIFQALNSISITPTIIQRSGYEEQSQATCTRGEHLLVWPASG